MSTNKIISEINAEVHIARDSHDIQELISNRDHVLTQLAERRSETLFKQTGQFLMQDVADEYWQSESPLEDYIKQIVRRYEGGVALTWSDWHFSNEDLPIHKAFLASPVCDGQGMQRMA